MSRIVFITQEYDLDSTIVGVARDWVAALAARCDGVDVIAQVAPAGQPVPPGVRVFSLGKDRGAGPAAQLAAFYGALARTLSSASAVLVHMVPRFAVLAAPLAAALGRPMMLWYAQGGVSAELRVASRLSRWIITPTRDSFPLSGQAVDCRLVVTGHGINTARYAPSSAVQANPHRLMAAGRLSPSKRLEVLVNALSLLPHRTYSLRLVGGPLYRSDMRYQQQLQEQASALGLYGQVDFAGMVPYDQIAGEYRAAWVLAHASGTGSLDKVVLEAMACGTPVVSSAPSSRHPLGVLADRLWCPSTDATPLAERLWDVLRWSPGEREAVGHVLRQQVIEHHSLDGWADRVIRVIGAAGGST